MQYALCMHSIYLQYQTRQVLSLNHSVNCSGDYFEAWSFSNCINVSPSRFAFLHFNNQLSLQSKHTLCNYLELISELTAEEWLQRGKIISLRWGHFFKCNYSYRIAMLLHSIHRCNIKSHYADCLTGRNRESCLQWCESWEKWPPLSSSSLLCSSQLSRPILFSMFSAMMGLTENRAKLLLRKTWQTQ